MRLLRVEVVKKVKLAKGDREAFCQQLSAPEDGMRDEEPWAGDGGRGSRWYVPQVDARAASAKEGGQGVGDRININSRDGGSARWE
jgi:hypothetical protein